MTRRAVSQEDATLHIPALHYIHRFTTLHIAVANNRPLDFKVLEINVDVRGTEKLGPVFVNSYSDLISLFCCISKPKSNICHCYDM